MKTKILFGVIFSICVVLMVNTTSAVEYRTVTDFNVDLINSELEKINNNLDQFSQLVEKLQIKSNNIEVINNIEGLSDELSAIRASIVDNPALPTFIFKLFGFLIGLIFSIIGTIIGTIFGIIFGPLLSLVVRILVAPIVLLARIIAFITNIFTP